MAAVESTDAVCVKKFRRDDGGRCPNPPSKDDDHALQTASGTIRDSKQFLIILQIKLVENDSGQPSSVTVV